MKKVKIMFVDNTRDISEGTILFTEGFIAYYSFNSKQQINRPITEVYYFDPLVD